MVQKLAILLLIAATTVVQADFYSVCRNPLEVEFFPHPDPALCRLFIICIFGFPQVSECPAGLDFDRIWDGKNCVEGDPINCVLGPVPTTTTTTTTTTEAAPGVPNPPIEGGVCKGVIFGLKGHPDYCYKYVWCLLGFGFAYECPEGQIFSTRTNLCLRGNRETCSFWRSGDVEAEI